MKFYSETKPFNSQYLQVDKIHEIYIEEYGNKNGIPIIFLHGGPGAGTSPMYQKFFDPDKYHLIMFDQRGCGKSLPYGETSNNTTQDLISDINVILNYLKIQRVHIYGGSWGSTLALLYAEDYPEKVLSLILRGVFLCRKNDIQWFYQHGASEIYPAYWEDYISNVKVSERSDILGAYHKMIFSDDTKVAEKACRDWSIWEGRASCMIPSKHVIDAFDDCSVSLARIESHYFINKCFIDENQILKNIDRILEIPCKIVHGQYDIVCPIRQAYDLTKLYPKSQLIVAPDAGHSLLEPSISREILKLLNDVT